MVDLQSTGVSEEEWARATADCVALRVDWKEGLGVHHTLLLHDCFVVNVDDWAAATETTVRLAQYLFRPEASR